MVGQEGVAVQSAQHRLQCNPLHPFISGMISGMELNCIYFIRPEGFILFKERIKGSRRTIFGHQSRHTDSVTFNSKYNYIRTAVSRSQSNRGETQTAQRLVPFFIHTAAFTNLRSQITHSRFRPIQAPAFADEFLLHREETNRLGSAFTGTEHSIRSMIYPVSAFIER
ncbi:hypothetical protein KC345_g12075 [Hortaea werneckii]|nr:hypothetical protein KC345_g12075 [Hortaea werneckii]